MLQELGRNETTLVNSMFSNTQLCSVIQASLMLSIEIARNNLKVPHLEDIEAYDKTHRVQSSVLNFVLFSDEVLYYHAHSQRS